MRTPDKTIDHGSLRRLIDSGAQLGAEVIGSVKGWGLVINYGRARQTLAATRGQPRTWRQFETLAGYLKGLGIAEVRVHTASFKPKAVSAAVNKPDQRSLVASNRMKRAHQAAAHDEWFRQQVQASIDDPRPSVADEQARKEFAEKRAALAQRLGKTKRPVTR
jgi:DNA-binding transcriptional regulator of glucitol operon